VNFASQTKGITPCSNRETRPKNQQTKKLDLRWSYGTVLFVFFKAVGVEALFLHHSYSLAGRNQRGLRGLWRSSNLEVKITWRERLRVQARSLGISGLRKPQFLSIG